MAESSREFLIFLLEGKEYGVDILKVQEIMVWTPVTELPTTPDYLKGVINLRGVIVPIIDMRLRFGHAPIDYNATTVVIVLRASDEHRSVVVGIVVDEVSQVYKLSDKDIKPAPALGSEIDSSFITALATVEEKIVMLLDANQLLDVDELYRVSQYGRPVKAQEEQGVMDEA